MGMKGTEKAVKRMAVNVDLLQCLERDVSKTSSKGNQNKWFDQVRWYKEDGLGYEALAEVLISCLLAKTNVNSFVTYRYEQLKKGDKYFRGCSSLNFMEPEDDKVVSVERLFQTYLGESAAKAMLAYPKMGDRIRFVVEIVEAATGLEKFGEYLKKVLTIDALFLNEDRHFHNLAVIQKKDGTFRECPIFDHGAALFSDVKGDYPLELSLEQCFQKIQAKPFSRDFDEQLDACEMLYGGGMFRAFFGMRDVEEVLKEFEGIYEEAVLRRVRQVMQMQIRKYAYLF